MCFFQWILCAVLHLGICVFVSVSFSISMSSVCVTVQGTWGSVLGSVCVCAAGTVHVYLSEVSWKGGRQTGGWTAGRLLQHPLQTEQKHSWYCDTNKIECVHEL